MGSRPSDLDFSRKCVLSGIRVFLEFGIGWWEREIRIDNENRNNKRFKNYLLYLEINEKDNIRPFVVTTYFDFFLISI